MQIFLVVIFNGLGALGLQLIINNMDKLGTLYAFLLSLVTYLIIGISNVFKDKCDPQAGFVYILGVVLALAATFALLSPAVSTYRAIWSASSSFWTKAVLVWLALQALTAVWVALKKPQE